MSDEQPVILEVKDLCKHFPIYSRGLTKKQVGLVKARTILILPCARAKLSVWLVNPAPAKPLPPAQFSVLLTPPPARPCFIAVVKPMIWQH